MVSKLLQLRSVSSLIEVYVLRLTNEDGNGMLTFLSVAKVSQTSARLLGDDLCHWTGGVESLAQAWVDLTPMAKRMSFSLEEFAACAFAQ